MDFNGDGTVSQREKEFGRMFDCDENGKLDKSERMRAAKAWALSRYQNKKRMKAEGGKGFTGLDLDGDGKVSEEEKKFGMKFDANGNGKLDKDELVKAAKAWAEKRADALKAAQGKIAKMQAKVAKAAAREAGFDDEYAYAEEYYGDEGYDEEDYGYGYFDDEYYDDEEYDEGYDDEYYGEYYDDADYYEEDYGDYDDFEYADDSA